MKNILLLAASVFVFAGFSAYAQHEGHTQISSKGETAGSALQDAHNTMMKNMHVSVTGDPDVDFVTMMIPHHQGAVDMCNVQLQYGNDDEILKLCKDIVAAQNKEIAQMQEWLKANALRKP